MKKINGIPGRISEIVADRRTITANTDLRLYKYFGLSEGWWLRGQARFDTEMAKQTLQKKLARIKQCSLIAAGYKTKTYYDSDY
jgi:antitoxin HigA-1